MGIRLPLLKEMLEDTRPSPALDKLIRDTRMVDFSDWVYHGSPLEGLKDMLIHGIHGDQHGEVAEYDAFSTSINSDIMHYFSEGEGVTGIGFKVQNVKLVVLDDILTKLVTALPGSGFDAEVDDEEAFEEFCLKYRVPPTRYHRSEYALPWNYLSSIGADAFCYDYVWKRYQRGHQEFRDESEICFIGNNAINKLNHQISSIWVDDNEYDDKVAAIKAIEIKLNGDDEA
jgi:hypothetical protein